MTLGGRGVKKEIWIKSLTSLLYEQKAHVLLISKSGNIKYQSSIDAAMYMIIKLNACLYFILFFA